MVLPMADDLHRHTAARKGRFVRRESDARRDLERIHLMTIRREKMRLQNELERVRVNRKSNYVANVNANKLLSNRFGKQSTAASSKGEDAGNRRHAMMSSAKGGSRAVPSLNQLNSPRRTRTAGQVGSALFDQELPQIGNVPSPLKGELDMRRHKDDVRDPQTKINELKKSECRQKNLLSLKVDMFTSSLSPVPSGRSPNGSASPKPSEGDLFLTDVDTLKRNDSDVETRASFPPSNRKKVTRESIANFDVSDAKNAISKRLITADTIDCQNGNLTHVVARSEDVLPKISPTGAPPPPLARRPTVIRRESKVAILDRADVKKNKYMNTADNDNPKQSDAPKKTLETDISLSTLGGRDAKRVKEIIENPDIVFDQEKYAPDGALRTVHMLPDADSAYGLARKARYLRWRDPNETNYEQELSVNDIFGKTDKTQQRNPYN